jgi:hypothetical protein
MSGDDGMEAKIAARRHLRQKSPLLIYAAQPGRAWEHPTAAAFSLNRGRRLERLALGPDGLLKRREKENG